MGYYLNDIACSLFKYCLKHKGKWWANYFFYNKEVLELYQKIREYSIIEVMDIINDMDNPHYILHVKSERKLKRIK